MFKVAAAALVSENKILSHPAGVDSIPNERDKEDHVSMGNYFGAKIWQYYKNAENVVLWSCCGTQALDLLKPLEPSGAVKAGVCGVYL